MTMAFTETPMEAAAEQCLRERLSDAHTLATTALQGLPLSQGPITTFLPLKVVFQSADGICGRYDQLCSKS